MYSPPLTSSATPLMYDASSEARNAIAAACSLGARLATGRSDRRGSLLGAVAVAIEQRETTAFASEQQGGCTPDPTRRTGDDGDAVGEAMR
jgi:hypothetical protein